MVRRIMTGLLCIGFIALLFDSTFAQERQQRRSSRWGWTGPPIGSEIKDFELPFADGGTFKLSELRGKIVVIELGACT